MSRSYKVARREQRGEPVTFDMVYEDPAGRELTETFTCTGQVSSIALAELARHSEVEVVDPAAVAMLGEFFEEAFGDPVEYHRFLRFRRDHNVDDEIIMQIMADLIEDFSARPTTRPASSPGGPSSTGRSSRDASSFVVIEGTGGLDQAFSA